MRYIDPTKPEQGRATTQSVRDNFLAIKENSLMHVYTGTFFVAEFTRSAVYLVTPARTPRSSEMGHFSGNPWLQFRPQLNLYIEGPRRWGGYLPHGSRLTGAAWVLFVVNFQGERTSWRGVWQPVGTSQINNVSWEISEMGSGIYPYYLQGANDRQHGDHYHFTGGYWERTISDSRPFNVLACNTE